MKTFLLLTLLSLYFCRYCNEITSANGVDDCKNHHPHPADARRAAGAPPPGGAAPGRGGAGPGI